MQLVHDSQPNERFRFEERLEFCDLCGGTELLSVAEYAHVVECAACGYRFVTPRPSQPEIAESYSDPHFYDGWVADDAGRERMWQKRLEIVRRHSPGTTLLDVGAGIGTFLALARDEAGWDVTGTEVSISAVRMARQRHEIELLHGQMEDVDLPHGYFDAVTLWHVLEHVPSPARLIRLCHAALTPRGILVIGLPNDGHVAAAVTHAKGRILRVGGRDVMTRYERPEPGREIHLSHFTEPVLSSFLRDEGFRIRLLSVDDHYPKPTARTCLEIGSYRVLRRLTGINIGIAMLVIAERI